MLRVGSPLLRAPRRSIRLLTEAVAFDPDARILDEWVADSAFRAVLETRELLDLRSSERLLLDAALARRAR